MHNALADFKVGMAEARQSGVVYDYLAAQLGAQFSFEDLLRFQLVYSVSAFDKFIHDLIRIGMRDCFSGVRLQTAKFKAEQIALELHGVIASKAEDELRAKIFHLPTPVPPKEYIFEQEVQKNYRNTHIKIPTKSQRA